MKKVNIIAIALGVFLASCGDTAKKSEEKEMSHDEMHEAGVDHDDHSDHDAMAEEAEESELLAIPEGAKVFFANLKDGQTITSPVKIEFGVEGMEVQPAGELNEGKGHHHIIINGGPLDRGIIVPADSVNIHFGKGQTETELDLPAGKHMLTMQFADGYHQSYGLQLSSTISVVVE
jgi:hypothetical protein